MILNYHMLLFSGFTLAKNYNFYLGYTFVLTAATMTFVNLGFMINGNLKKQKNSVRLVNKKAMVQAAAISS
jgi:hypothetical protein